MVVGAFVDCQLYSAVLTTEAIPTVDVYAGKLDGLLHPLEGLKESDNGRHLDHRSASDATIVFFQNLDLVEEQKSDRPLPANYFYGFEISTQNQRLHDLLLGVVSREGFEPSLPCTSSKCLLPLGYHDINEFYRTSDWICTSINTEFKTAASAVGLRWLSADEGTRTLTEQFLKLLPLLLGYVDERKHGKEVSG